MKKHSRKTEAWCKNNMNNPKAAAAFERASEEYKEAKKEANHRPEAATIKRLTQELRDANATIRGMHRDAIELDKKNRAAQNIARQERDQAQETAAQWKATADATEAARLELLDSQPDADELQTALKRASDADAAAAMLDTMRKAAVRLKIERDAARAELAAEGPQNCHGDPENIFPCPPDTRDNCDSHNNGTCGDNRRDAGKEQT
jgi:hypothetical protein